jgi:hypothetical protein
MENGDGVWQDISKKYLHKDTLANIEGKPGMY